MSNPTIRAAHSNWPRYNRSLRDASWVHLRGSVVQRVFAHDIYHSAERTRPSATPAFRSSTSGTDTLR